MRSKAPSLTVADHSTAGLADQSRALAKRFLVMFR